MAYIVLLFEYRDIDPFYLLPMYIYTDYGDLCKIFNIFLCVFEVIFNWRLFIHMDVYALMDTKLIVGQIYRLFYWKCIVYKIFNELTLQNFTDSFPSIDVMWISCKSLFIPVIENYLFILNETCIPAFCE